jgi:hypothetical protein
MVQLIFLLLKQPFVIIQQTVISLLYAIPFVFGLLLAAAGASVRLTTYASVSAFNKLPESADTMSREWTRRTIMAGFPYLWQQQLKRFFYAIAVLTIVSAWGLILLTPGFLVSLLF